jgi:hypothetical protein
VEGGNRHAAARGDFADRESGSMNGLIGIFHWSRLDLKLA